tara:strand:- start:3872 stop:4132 length:261 start_codon:yes stop_codon:yes gene_type:complete
MTIREHVGNIAIAPQYSKHEANELIREFAERVQLEGVLIESDIKHFGEAKVESEMAERHFVDGVDVYHELDIDTLKDQVDWSMCSR